MGSEATISRLKKTLCHQEAEIQRLTKKLDEVCGELVERKKRTDCVLAQIVLVRIQFFQLSQRPMLDFWSRHLKTVYEQTLFCKSIFVLQHT